MDFEQDYQKFLGWNENIIMIWLLLITIIFILLSVIILKYLINYQQDTNSQKIHSYNYDLDTWAIITGATDGIGLEFAKQFYDKNWNLILVSRNQEKLENVILEHFSNPNKITTVIGYPLDYSRCKAEDFDLFYEQQLKNKKISVLINNVGTGYTSPEYMHLINRQLITDTCKVNIESTIFMTQIVIKRMLQTTKKNFILNISSASGAVETSPLISIYGASKAFMNHWTTSMNTEYTGRITFEVLTPFYITTKLSGYTEESLSIPSAKNYVEHAMCLIANGRLSQTGYYYHTFLLQILKCLPLKYRSEYIFNAYNKFKK